MARKKGGGGKLNRSEIIQARLDPKLHMAAEIMARTERRTLSSFIEKSIEQAARNNKVKRNLMFLWWMENPEKYYLDRLTSDEVTVEKAVQDIGTDHEAIRFLKFATYFPDLLNADEKRIFNNIVLTPYFWLHYPYKVEDKKGNLIKIEWDQVAAIEGLDKENLIEYWDRLKSNQVDFTELCKLPPGKKISEPMKEDVRAIRKKITTGKSISSFKIIYAWKPEQIEISPDNTFWEKNIKKLTPKKIEIKQTDEGPQIIATYLPDVQEEFDWVLYFKESMKEKYGS